MTCTATPAFPKALYLTDEEALALLDLCLTAKCDLDACQEQAFLKIGEFCREGLHVPHGSAKSEASISCRATAF